MLEKRLIDVDVAENSIRNAAASVRASIGCGYDEGWADALSSVADMLKTTPTVDAVEVVHGRWVPVPSSDMMNGKAYKCSECGKMRYGSFMPNYCQNCGAKMDGDGNA